MKTPIKIFIYACLFFLPVTHVVASSIHSSNHDTLIIEGDMAYPPFEYINAKGQPDGMNIELTRTLMKRMGRPYKLRLRKWSKVLESFRKGKVDILMGVNFSNERSKSFNYGPAHNYIYQDVIFRKDGKVFHTAEQLRNKSIVLERGAISAEILQSLGVGHHAVYFDDLNEGLLALSEGKYDAAVCEHEVAASIIEDKNLSNLQSVGLGLPPLEYRYVCNNDQLLEKIDVIFYKMKKDGTYNRIYSKWMIAKPATFDMRLLYSIILLIVVISVVSISFIALLRKKVNKARQELDVKNKRLSLALRAGELSAWLYDVQKRQFYNLEGDVVPDKGYSYEVFRNRIHPDDRHLFDEIIGKATEGVALNKSIQFRVDRHGDGNYLVIDKDLAVIHNRDGEVRSIVGVDKDVTLVVKKQKEEKELTEKYQTIFESSDIGLEYFDKSGKLLDINDAACAIYGVTDKKIFLSRGYSIFDNPMVGNRISFDNLNFHDVVKLINKVDADEEQSVIVGREEDDVTLEMMVKPIYSEGVLKCIIMTIKDITEMLKIQHLQEETLRKMKLSVKYANMVFWEYDREKHLCLFYSSTISSYHDVTKATEEQIISNVHPDDKHKMKDLIDRMHEGDEEIISTDVRLLSATDKKWHFCNPIATAFKRDSETGKVSMYVGFTCDYSEVYKLNKEVADYARKLNYLIESSKVKLWSYDLSTKVVSFRDGDKVRTMLPEDVVAKDDDKVRSRSIFDQMDKGEIGEFSIQVKYTLNGRTYHTINNGIPVKDDKGNLTGYFGSLRDITDLIEIQNRLEQEKEKAQQADKLKSTFLANMSHEIRTPLNAIIGFADILVDVDSRDEKQEFVNIIRLNSDTLLRIISDILDLSKIEAGTIDLKNEEFDLSLMFNDFATGISPMVTEGIEYIIDNPYPKCFVKGDKERIVQVLTNFVTNAIKYTSQGHIKVGYKYDNDGMLFYCEDTGVGIEEAKQKLVFERFEKLGSMVQGTGLGLAICKAIADCLKGYIWVESKYGEGSTFYIWLPLQPRYE